MVAVAQAEREEVLVRARDEASGGAMPGWPLAKRPEASGSSRRGGDELLRKDRVDAVQQPTFSKPVSAKVTGSLRHTLAVVREALRSRRIWYRVWPPVSSMISSTSSMKFTQRSNKTSMAAAAGVAREIDLNSEPDSGNSIDALHLDLQS